MRNFGILLLFGCISGIRSYKRAYATLDNYEYSYLDDGDDRVSWCEATSGCAVEGYGVSLAKLNTGKIHDFVIDMLAPWGSPWVWIGGSDLHSENFWLWLDGEQINNGFTKWAQGEPNDKLGEDCLQLNYVPQYWNDQDCGKNIGYVCQRDLSVTTTADFVVLTFSDTFTDFTKQAMTIDDARVECGNRGMNLIRDFNSATPKGILHRQLTEQAKYWIENENDECRVLSKSGVEGQDCIGKTFPFICAGFRPHYIKISDENPKVFKSDDIQLDCVASGSPIPEVTWQTDEDIISTDTRQSTHQIISEGGSSLVIKKAKERDEGRYRCIATNRINGEKISLKTYVELEVVKKNES